MSHFVTRNMCPACHATDPKPLYSMPMLADTLRDYLIHFYTDKGSIDLTMLEGAHYTLHECQTCGLVYQYEIPDEALMIELYERWLDPDLSYQRQLAREHMPYFRPIVQEVMTAIAALGKKPADVTILDFGLGWGHWSRLAAAFGCTVYGLEVSESRIQHAQKLGIQILDWEAVPQNRFDLINADRVFEHLDAPLDTLQHLVKGLANDGAIKINVPNGQHIHTALGQPDWYAPRTSPHSMNAVAPLEHINCFHQRALVTMAEKAGLRVFDLPLDILAAYQIGDSHPDPISQGTHLFFRRAV